MKAQHSSGKRGLPSFPPNGGPEGWVSSGTTETNDRFFFSYTISTVLYNISLFVASLRSMFTVNDARCTSELETAYKQHIKH